MICINLIFKYGETGDKNKVIDYIKNEEDSFSTVEKIKGLENFYSVKTINKNIDTILRVIDASKCKVKDETLEKIIEKLNSSEEIDEKIIFYIFVISAESNNEKINSLMEIIKIKNKDNHILLIKDKDKVNKIKIDSILLKYKNSLNKDSLLFINDENEVEIIKYLRKLAGKRFLEKNLENNKKELINIYEEFLIKEIYLNINKIKLQNREELFDKKDNDLNNYEVLKFKEEYISLLKNQISLIEKAVNKYLDLYSKKFEEKYLKFEVFNYGDNLELEFDNSKVSNLYKEFLENNNYDSKNEKFKFIKNLFNNKIKEEETNTREIERFIIEESFKSKLSLEKSLENLKF